MPIWIVILPAVLVRCAGLFRPLLGNFAVYGTAQAMIAKIFVEQGFSNWLAPQINVIVSGKPGLILLYYPVSSLLVAALHFFTRISLDVLGRAQAVFFFALSALYLYRLVKRLFGDKHALLSAAVFSLLPLTVIYGQSFQNEMATVFFTLLFLDSLMICLRQFTLRHAGLAALGLSLVLLTRPNNLYLGLPALYLVFSGPAALRWKRLGWGTGIAVFSALVPGLWYWHIWNLSQANPNIYSTLFAQLMVRSSFVSTMALQGSYYREIFDQLMGIVLTPPGLIFFILGLWSCARKRSGGFFLLWAAGFLASSLLIPRKLIDHNFYWLHFVIPASVVIADGFLQIRSRKTLWAVWGIMALFSFRYFYHPAFVTPASDRAVPAVAAALKKLTDKKNDRIIVQGTHTLLYYADRYGSSMSVENPSGNVSEYYKFMNWQQLPQAQWEKRNKAFERPETKLEYFRDYEGITHLAISDYASFENTPMAAYLRRYYTAIYDKPGVGIVFDLRTRLTSFD